MTSFKDIEEWAKLLPPMPQRIPSVLKVTRDTYNTLRTEWASPTPPYYPWESPKVRFDSVRIVIVDDLEAPWIMYDQNGEEMGRAQ